MNRKELIDAMLTNKEISNWSKKDCETFIHCLTDTIKSTVKKGDDVSLFGFGTFTKIRRAARNGVNPSTGEKIKIKAKTSPKFKPAKGWKDMF